MNGRKEAFWQALSIILPLATPLMGTEKAEQAASL